MKISRQGDRFFLQNDQGDEISLSHLELQELASNSRKILDQLEPLSPRRAEFPLAWTVHTARALVQMDAYRQQVLLRLVDREGLETAFALSLDLAKGLSDQLSLLLAGAGKPPKLDG